MRFLEFGGDIKIVVIPEHFGASAVSRFRFSAALNVGEILRPRRRLPGMFVEFAVDDDRPVGAVADVALRNDVPHSLPVVRRLFLRVRSRRQRGDGHESCKRQTVGFPHAQSQLAHFECPLMLFPNYANGAHESGTGLDFNLYSLVTGVRSGYELGPSPMPWKAEAQ